MAVDRSKFKPTSAQQMKENSDAVQNALGRNGNGNRPGMVEITEGKNIFRIFPAHPDTDGDFAKASVKTFLPMMVKEKVKEGDKWVESENEKESARPVFNGRIHGDKPKDLVEEYIKLARKVAEDEIADKAKREVYLNKVYGKFSPNKDQRLPGIQYKTAYVMYVNKLALDGSGSVLEFGRLEVGKLVKDDMNTIAGQEAAGEPLGVDPFTDLEDGRALVIHHQKPKPGVQLKPADYYKTSLDTDFDKVSKQIKLYPISDEALEEFAKQPTLESMYKNVFSRRDFELQVVGLEFFDNKYNMGIVERDEWAKIQSEIGGWYPVDGEEELDEVDEEEDELEEEGSSDKFSLMSRMELKQYNTTKKLGLVFKTSQSDDDIREAIRTKEAARVIPHVDLPGEEKEEEEETTAPVTKSTTAKPGGRLANLRGSK